MSFVYCLFLFLFIWIIGCLIGCCESLDLCSSVILWIWIGVFINVGLSECLGLYLLVSKLVEYLFWILELCFFCVVVDDYVVVGEDLVVVVLGVVWLFDVYIGLFCYVKVEMDKFQLVGGMVGVDLDVFDYCLIVSFDVDFCVDCLVVGLFWLVDIDCELVVQGFWFFCIFFVCVVEQIDWCRLVDDNQIQ